MRTLKEIPPDEPRGEPAPQPLGRELWPEDLERRQAEAERRAEKLYPTRHWVDPLPEFDARAWDPIIERVLIPTLRGAEPDHPTAAELGAAIRACPRIPVMLAGYVADRIQGRHKRHRGRPATDPTARWQRAKTLGLDVSLRQAAFRLQDLSDPRGRALDVVARQHHVSAYTLEKDWLRDPLEDAPAVYRLSFSADQAERFVEWMRATGKADLDPNAGLVWITPRGEIPE